MINLTTSTINPSFIEETILETGERCSDGGYYITISNCHYWSPTQTAVVVYFSSGRVKVYGGDDANTIWMYFQGKPACADTNPSAVLEGYGLVVNVHEGTAQGRAIVDATYEWACATPATMKSDDVAGALLRLLVDNGYVDAIWLDGNYEAEFDGGLSVVRKGEHWDSDLVMAYT